MKSFVLACSLLLLTPLLHAQTWQELNDSLLHYFYKGDNNKALPFAEKAIIAAKNESGELHINYAHTITYLAMLYSNTGQSDKAETFYLKASDLYKKISGETNSYYATSLNNLGGFYEGLGNYSKAEPLYVQATAIIKKDFGEDHTDYAASLHSLGVLYSNIGNYEKAEPLLLQAAAIRKKSFGEDHPDYATSLDKLALLYMGMGNYEKAETLFIQATAIRKKVLGEDHIDYTYSLSNLATVYERMGEYEKAEPFFIESMAIQKKILGENNIAYAGTLEFLGWLYKSMGKYEKSEAILLQAIAIRKKIHGENHPYYATGLNNLASVYIDMGKYEKAESLYIQVTAIIKKVLGEDHPNYPGSLHNLALLYNHTGEFKKAELLYIEAITKGKNIIGETHTTYATMIQNLAGLYERMGHYEKAEPLFIQAAAIIKKVLGENLPEYASCINSLAVLYTSMGHYEKAEPLFIQATAIRKKVLGEFHPVYAASLDDMAKLYEVIGNYEKAEELFLQEIAISKTALGENHPEYATALNNLALLYTSMGHYEKAEPLFIQSLAIDKKMVGDSVSKYAGSLNNLARLYEKMGKYEKAEPLHMQAKEIFKMVHGESSPNYATSLNNLAVLYKSMGNYKKAEPIFIQASAIRKKVLGETHPHYATSLHNLAELFETTGRYEKAEPLLAMENKIKIQNLLSVFSTLSEKEKGNYLANTLSLNNSNNSFLYSYRKAQPQFYKDNYNLQLLLKSLSLSDTKNALDVVRKSKDTTINKLFAQWQNNKTTLSKEYSLPVANRDEDIRGIETQTENLEKELNRRSTEFRAQQNTIRITLQDVQKNLQPDEVAIEFVSFKLFNKKWTDSIMYAAYILRKGDTYPQFVPLCEEKLLRQLFDSAGNTSTTMVSSLYRNLDKKNKNIVFLGKELYNLVWLPLEPYLKGIKKISYSPAGKLYSIAFQALPIDSVTVLMDKYQLQQYTSTRQIALRSTENETIAPGNITLFGNASFTMDSLQLLKQKTNTPNDENISKSIYTIPNRSNENGVWRDLDGTAYEVKMISQLFDLNHINNKTFVKTAASEENLKALNGNSPQILHIATHGFFLPEPDKKKKEKPENGNTYTLADDPLLRSGLVMAGGNYAWSGNIMPVGVEDGIATAYEISQLNLSNTELVVLSACETALGDVKGSEGVFGLQRAFKMAGVKKMIVSLWQVPDKETAELMTGFYSYWMKGKTISDAFTQAQADMRKKYSPFYWAAFVLVE